MDTGRTPDGHRTDTGRTPDGHCVGVGVCSDGHQTDTGQRTGGVWESGSLGVWESVTLVTHFWTFLDIFGHGDHYYFINIDVLGSKNRPKSVINIPKI